MLGHRFTRFSLALAIIALTVVPTAALAAGWQEMHQTADDVRLDIGPDGIATVQHHLRYRIVAGHFKTFDVVGIDPRGEIAPEAMFTAEKGGAEILARVEPVPKTPGTVRIMIDEAKGLGRGVYLVEVKYRLDLVATKMLTRDGAMWKLAWTAPPAPEGQDGARVIFDVPAAATEPRLAASAESTTTLSTLRRSAERDELELVRAHIPRGEAAIWTARVDPKAFPRVTSTELRPPPMPEVVPPSVLGSDLSRALVAVGLAGLAGALAALLRKKQSAVRAAAALRNARAVPLLPLPVGVAPFAFGVVATLALAMLLWSSPIAGALLVALAMALAAHRAPSPIIRPRGPGSWRPVSDPHALLPGHRMSLPTDTLDLGTTRAKVAFAAITIAVGAASWLLRSHVPQIAIALPLAATSIVPIFVTGTRAQMVPSPTELAATMLRPTRDALAKVVDLAHVELDTIGRLVGKRGALDEIRLVCAPRDRTPGLRAIELALATSPSDRGALPEVLLRFDDGSAAAERIAHLATGLPLVPGRTPDERVLRLSPPEPTPAATAALLAKLLLALEGRRTTDRSASSAPVRWPGKERRTRLLPPSPPLPAL